MQIWIYFIAGAGGDGFANLLEFSTNVENIDSDLTFKRWRVQHWVDNSPKFWAPDVDSIRCFRNNQPFRLNNNFLRRNYVKMINAGIPTICTSHDIKFKALEQSDCQDILCRNQIRVLLTHNNYATANKTARIKNLLADTVGIDPLKEPIDHLQFDYVLNINDIQQDWSVVDKFCKQVGLVLDKKYYDEYRQIQQGAGQLLSYAGKYFPKKFISSTVDGFTTYKEI